MKYQIDQSGKIENTSKDTIVAYSNGEQYSVLVSKKIKRQVQELFRLIGMPRLYVYILFSCSVYMLIKKFKIQHNFTIDIEYPGKEKLLKNLLTCFLESNKKPNHNIRFARIGNHPKVHYAAYNVYTKKEKPNVKITLWELLEEIKKADGRLRECFSTLVDAQPRPLIELYQKRLKSQARAKFRGKRS
ncbi:MAG: hypothetical protein AAB546_01720 [Patescibacteria group bacterium]